MTDNQLSQTKTKKKKVFKGDKTKNDPTTTTKKKIYQNNKIVKKEKTRKVLTKTKIAEKIKQSSIVVLTDTTIQVKIRQHSNIQDSAFTSLSQHGVSQQSLDALDEMGMKYMNDIQHRIITPLLKGCDMLVKCGYKDEGKRLMLILQAIEVVHKLNMRPKHGTGAIIIVPTRERASEMHSLLTSLSSAHKEITKCMGLHGKEINQEANVFTTSMVTHGKLIGQEKKDLTSGVNILVATPGRLLNHLQNVAQFNKNNLQFLVVDEADEIIKLGLEDEMVKILSLLPDKRQSVVCTSDLATTENISKLALKKLPLYIDAGGLSRQDVDDESELGYIICPSHKRLIYLQSLLRRNKSKKIVVYFSTAASADYHEALLEHINIRTSVIHGLVKQPELSDVFMSFCNADSGTLLCTELVARNLDMPKVDLVIIFDQPSSPQTVTSRVGESKQPIILFLQPNEETFLDHINMTSQEVKMTKVTNMEMKINELNKSVYSLHISSREAYKSYVSSYASHYMKDVFDVSKLDLEQVARGFGFHPPPFVELDIHS